MNLSGGKTPPLARPAEYTNNALEQIRRELMFFDVNKDTKQQAVKLQNGRLENGSPQIEALLNGYALKPQAPQPPQLGGKVIRKPSIEREIQGLQFHRGSPALDSGAGSSRSDSPHSHQQLTSSRGSTGQYSPSPCPSSFSDAPPLPPPRGTSTPPTPPPVPANFQQLFKRMASPAAPPTRPVPLPAPSPARGTSPVSNTNHRQPMIVQNGPQAQQQLSHQMQALNLYQSGNNGEPPPPYPIISGAPPSYTVSLQSRQSPTQSTSDYRKSPSSGIYSGTSAGSPSPITIPQPARPVPLSAWSARQTKTQQPVIMQSVKSTQVQKPVLQTAVAPTAPATPPICTSPVLTTVAPPSYASSIHQKAQIATPITSTSTTNSTKPPPPAIPSSTTPPSTPIIPNSNVTNGNVIEPPSYASTMQAFLAASHQTRHLPPPPPYTNNLNNNSENNNNIIMNSDQNNINLATIPPLPPNAMSSKNNNSQMNGVDNNNHNNNNNNNEGALGNKIKHQSPIPERRNVSKEKDEERKEDRMKHYSPQAFKFYMEQHIENVMKSYKQRAYRKSQLEYEMEKAGLTEESQMLLRKVLSQKESNYIRLKRAKMDKSMFVRIKHIGVGAFGEVSLVRKVDTPHQFYAMKTLRKADVLKRNQVAHVKAERDILAEADNEWVVKLYYSFQDKDNLYFVMDYIPGGDLMSLLIKKGIFEEKLAQFYIAELTCAVESVHKMGFIHRDIKPDNILIDRDGHIKLTDFGLCTGFRWTHDSKYYQKNGDHNRQDSMEPWEENCDGIKPTVLERRRLRENLRSLAHSLVGTPNYIAPEVLERSGYTQLCDWWSVGVILYEMLVGQPPFLANTPLETQQKVINWEKTLHIPSQPKLTQEATDLILRLCSSPERRLGKNADEVKLHKFFQGIDFESGLRKQAAPYIPKIEHPTDTSNFDPVDPEKLHNSSADSNRSNDDFMDTGKPFHGFFEFTFRRFFDDNSKSSNGGDGEGCYV